MNMKKYFEASMMHLLENKSIDSITVSEIIEDVGSCKGTFYKHYLDKYSLCCSCIQHNVYCDVSMDAESWGVFVMQCLTAFEKHSKVVLHAFSSDDVNSARKYHEKLVREYLLRHYADNGGDLQAVNNIITLTVYGTMVTNIMIDWLKEGRKRSKEEVYSILCAIIPQTVFREINAQTA